MKQLGDITKIDVDKLEPVDIICAGSPCQDLSVAGKREGLNGERSGLFRTAIDIVHRLRNRTGMPRYFVWENVPGAFSSNKGYRKTIHVHKLVAMAFLNREHNRKWINHKDGNKENNNVDNLEWCTPSENQKHSWQNGMTVFTEKMRQVAIEKFLREVEKQKRKVSCFSNGVLVNTYESASEAARQIRGSQAHISDCCNGKRYTHKGFSWAWA